MRADFITALMSLGRDTDSRVGHLTPGEVVIPREIVDEDPRVLTPFIRAMTKRGVPWRRFVVGQGEINPRTGIEEFAWQSGSGSFGGRDKPSASVSSSSSYSMGSNASGYGPGSGSGFANIGAGQSIGSAVSGRDSSGVAQASPPQTTAPRPADPAPAAPTYAEGGPIGSAGSRPGGPSDVAGNEPSTFGRLLNDALGAPSGRSLGLLGQLYAAGPIGPLMGFTSFMQNVLGIPGEVDWEPGNPNPAARNSQNEARVPGNLDYRAPMAQTIKQVANAAVAAGLIDPPAWLKRSIEGLSPLQQRAYIATKGTAGAESGYRSRDAYDYYRGLLTNTPYENVLPVEHQYLRDIWGANYGKSTASLMQALAAI